jgi:hypothetical protein
MAEIADFRNTHVGEEVFLLGNADSLMEHQEFLNQEGIHKIGINSSNEHVQADYHVLVDSAAGYRFVKHQYMPKYVFYAPGALACEIPEGVNRVQFNPKVNSYVAWSYDCGKYIQVCKSSMWVALQLAQHMGFSYAYLMGFELGGPRIKGHVHEGSYFLDENAERQLQLMGYLRGLIDAEKVDMKVFVTSLTTKCQAFPFVTMQHRDITRNFLYKAKPPDINVTWDY